MDAEWWAAANCIPTTVPRRTETAATVASNNLIESSPYFYDRSPCESPLGRSNIPQGIALDLDKDMIAVGVDPFGIIPLQANAFDDVEFSRALAKVDAGRLPGCGQDFRGEDIQIVVQDIGARKMHPLGDLHVAVVGNARGLAHRQIGLRQHTDGFDDERAALPMA